MLSQCWKIFDNSNNIFADCRFLQVTIKKKKYAQKYDFILQEIRATKIFKHPNFDRDLLFNDVAVVLLEQSVDLTRYKLIVDCKKKKYTHT